jgi:hypothetical protein
MEQLVAERIAVSPVATLTCMKMITKDVHVYSTHKNMVIEHVDIGLS